MNGDDQETGYGPPGSQSVPSDPGGGLPEGATEVQGTPWDTTGGFHPGINPEIGGSPQRASQASAIEDTYGGGFLSSIGRALASLIGFHTVIEQDPMTGMFSAASRWGPHATGEPMESFIGRSLFNQLPFVGVDYKGQIAGLDKEGRISGSVKAGDVYGGRFSPLDAAGLFGGRAAGAVAGALNFGANAADTDLAFHGGRFTTEPSSPAIQELSTMFASTDPYEGSIGPSSAAPAAASRGPAVQAIGTAPPPSWDGGQTPLWWLNAAPRAA